MHWELVLPLEEAPIHCHGHIHIARSPRSAPPHLLPPFSTAASSSSLLQFCLNYFACLFMVESLILALVSPATLTTRRCNYIAGFCSFCRMRGRDLDNARGDGLRNERSLPISMIVARPDLRWSLRLRLSRDRAIQVFRKMDYSCLLFLSGTHAKFLLLLLQLTTRMEVFEIGRRDVEQAKQLPYLWLIYIQVINRRSCLAS